MGSADPHDVNGNRPGSRESGGSAPRDVICGDDPYLDYSGVPARFQRLRGPYPLRAGAAAYQQHLAEDYLTMGAR
jgi:hypothetical protein